LEKIPKTYQLSNSKKINHQTTSFIQPDRILPSFLPSNHEIDEGLSKIENIIPQSFEKSVPIIK
jgi:hypothetical protein